MDKNSLIQEIKNDLNSIKKQVEVTLAKLEVLEALYKLDVVKVGTLDSSVHDSESQAVELGISSEDVLLNVSEKLEVKEPIVEPEPEPIVEPESELVVEKGPELEPEVVVEQGAETEQVIELEIEEKVEEKEIIEEENEEVEVIPNSSFLIPNSKEPLRNLMSIIGLNDRFRFRHDLFSDSNDLFKETIEILNTIENFDKAVDYLQDKFKWNEEDATVVYFYEIIKPKF